MEQRYDFIVVGSGIAGLSFALKVAHAGHSVCILTKKDRAESNTNYAQFTLNILIRYKTRYFRGADI